MKRSCTVSLILLALVCGASAWALTEDEQTGIDALLKDTMASLTTGEPALWNLFSTQGSAAVIRTSEGFAAANRGKLKADPDVAAQFTLPEGVTLADSSLMRVGEFIMGRAQLEGKAPAPSEAGRTVPEGSPLRDLWSAFWHSEQHFFVRQPKADEAAAPAESPAPEPTPKPPKWELTLAAVQDGPERSWRHVSLCIAPVAEESDGAGPAGESVVQVLKSWEQAVLQGDMTPLTESLYPDPFCVAGHLPDGQAWFFTYPEYLITMMGAALGMGSAEQSQMLDLSPKVSGPVGTILGQWAVEVPMFGNITLGLTATLVQPEDKWMLVAMCAGMLEEY